VENYVRTEKKNGYFIPFVQQCGLGLSVSIKMLKRYSDQYLPLAFILIEGTCMHFYKICFSSVKLFRAVGPTVLSSPDELANSSVFYRNEN
jgi:hypothetical protein